MKIKSFLDQLGLQQNVYDPCLFNGHIHGLSNPANEPSSVPLTLGLYVDNFVYFSEDFAVEDKIQLTQYEFITVDFMGEVEWFLGTHFQWMITLDTVQVHLSQTGFVAK